MSMSLNDFLAQLDELGPEMKPERVFGATLQEVKVGVRLVGKGAAAAQASSAGCLAAGCSENSNVSSVVSGSLGTAETKRFLRWLADSLDTDVPTLNLEVTAADGDTSQVQGAARRLATQAFA